MTVLIVLFPYNQKNSMIMSANEGQLSLVHLQGECRYCRRTGG